MNDKPTPASPRPQRPPPTPPPAATASNPPAILEQYKAYLQDVGNIGTRYTTSNAFYMSVITALLGILALTKLGEGLAELKTILGLAVPAFAIMLCWLWSQTVKFYRTLFKEKFDVLRDLQLLGGLHNAFPLPREDPLLKPNPSLLEIEGIIPVCLALPFAVILIHNVWRLLTNGV